MIYLQFGRVSLYVHSLLSAGASTPPPDSHKATSRSSSPSPFCPSPSFTRVWGYQPGKILELKMLVR